MNTDKKHNMSRRHFLKVAGGTAVASSAVLAACNSDHDSSNGAIAASDVPKGKMTYRTNPNTGDGSYYAFCRYSLQYYKGIT